MMDWFKMQTVWGASVERLSDAEAGRFIKALYAFVRGGDEYEGSSGREDPVTWQALETLRRDVESFKEKEANQKEKEEELKEKRREAAKARWMQKDAKASKRMQKDANADDCIICNASASENKNKNKEIDIKESPLTGTKEKAASLDRAFDKFWACYPRHEGKQNAKKAFVKVSPDDSLLNTMLTAIQRQKQTDQWSDPRYIPHPATWLNGRRWEDEPQRATMKPGKVVSAAQYQQRDYDEEDLEARLGVNDIFKGAAG